MVNKNKKAFFQESILNWYKSNGRHFPWRNKSATNYERIISEVLLQRTKAVTVAKFYPLFINKYPSWAQLGNATEIELQETLKPLGLYNQRGIRMFKLAQEMKKRKGHFPTDKSVVEDFSMVGQYIANAYELFVLKKPAPLLDVNMARLLERFFGPRKLVDIRHDLYLQDLSKKVVNCNDPTIINWAILDYGSIVCTKKDPNCYICILKLLCDGKV